MNPTPDRLEAALDAWSVPDLSAELSARTLSRAHAGLGSDDRRPSRGTRVGRLLVPAVLGVAAGVLVWDTCLKIQQIFGT
jgi:hypothetical protein